jgi:hypothetical protein
MPVVVTAGWVSLASDSVYGKILCGLKLKTRIKGVRILCVRTGNMLFYAMLQCKLKMSFQCYS